MGRVARWLFTPLLIFAGSSAQAQAPERAAIEVLPADSQGERVDLARSHASISRTLPGSLGGDGAPARADPDALQWYVVGPERALPDALRVVSLRPSGEPLDHLEHVVLSASPCPEWVSKGLSCRRTPLIRATADWIDRSHPGSASRSLQAEVGGSLVVQIEGQKPVIIRVGGPRRTQLGPIERYRGQLRVRLVRMAPGGALPVGADPAAALAIARAEVRAASSLWGQCGIHFGSERELDIKIVDPPPPHLLAVGCDYGLPASGGSIQFRAEGREIRVRTELGQTPTEVANAVAQAVRKRGLRAEVSPNPRISPGALRTADVLVKKLDGSPLALEPPASEHLSRDATLNVCLGEVSLEDGLSHFTDVDAVAGTVEERALIKAFDDGNPSTIEVFIIPRFAQSGRIGESFIYARGASIRNVVVIDRASVRAGPRSYALAHELGHILLDMPDHPDDFGVDRPEALMDADAADPTIFGPRRLSIGECERAILQSGPGVPVPLLTEWPLPAPAAKAPAHAGQ